MDYFLKLYFQSLTEEFSDLKESEDFIKILMASTEKMIENNGQKTNKKVFKETFFSMVEVDDKKGVMDRFDIFYDDKYPHLKKKLSLDSDSPELISLLKEKNKKLIIATNPLFPRKAITDRMKWADLDPLDFDYITCYEDMHYAKPNPNFYREIVERLDLDPIDCVMIGNDCQEDMVAKEVGMSGYLIEDYLIDREKKAPEPDWQGTMDQLIESVREEVVF